MGNGAKEEKAGVRVGGARRRGDGLYLGGNR